MKVLMATPSYYPIKGGAETVIRNLSIKLNETGVHTDIMTFNMNQKWNPSWQLRIEKIDGINVFKIPALNWFPIEHSDRITLKVNLFPGRFRSHLKKYDIIHFHGGDLTFPLFSYSVKKSKIFHFHGFSLDFYKRYFLSRMILKRVAKVYISISHHMTNELAELGIPRYKIRYLPNAVDPRLFRPSGEKEDNLVLFVGRVSFDKGLHVMLKCLAFLEKPIHLVIIGPSVWDVRYFQGITKQIEDENKKGIHKITYLGAQDQANVIEWYQKAAILVLPTFREAAPLVNLEALSCETPVVASNVGAVSEVVCDGKNGILVPPNNSARLADAISYLLDSEDVRSNFGREGRKWVMEHFSLDVVVERLRRIYKEF